MKKHLFLFLLFSFPLYFFAQNIIILDSDSINVNGQTITFSGNINDTLAKFHFGVRNISSDSLDVKLKRTEIGKLAGTENYFCWSICYNPVYSGAKPTWTDMSSVPMIPDSTYENFSAYFLPNGISGIAGFHYVLYDVNNPNDSAFVDLMFDIALKTENINPFPVEFSLSPNPAINKLSVRFENAELSETKSIDIYNVLGEKLFTYKIPDRSKNISINTESYYSGIYFCVLKENGFAISSQKFVVSH